MHQGWQDVLSASKEEDLEPTAGSVFHYPELKVLPRQ